MVRGMPPRPLVIANPAARRGQTGRALGPMLAALRDAFGELDVAATTHPGNAIALAAAARSAGRPLVISLGGDGTLNEVVNGLLCREADAGGAAEKAADARPPLPPLGIVATGTGGDFAHSLGIEHRFEAYLQAIAGGHERRVDVGRARFAGNGGGAALRLWVNVLSAGIGGLVDRYVAGAPHWLGGRLSYSQATLRAIVTSRRRHLLLRATLADGSVEERELRAQAVAVCNGHTFGGGMRIGPGALLDDGLLQVVLIEASGKHRLVASFGTIYKGTHLDVEGVSALDCRALELRPAGPKGSAAGRAGVFPLDVDGDALGDVPLQVDLLPRALRVLAPPASTWACATREQESLNG
jgi:diacylglycerol kinase family enzyme